MKHCAVLLSAVLVASFSGCTGGSTDPTTGEVTGKVTVDGKPGAGLQVTFNPIDGGRTSMGVADNDGNYTLIYSPETLGAVLGRHRVSIAPGEPPVDASTDTVRTRLDNSTIPKKYTESPKVVEVKAGSNTIDLTYP